MTCRLTDCQLDALRQAARGTLRRGPKVAKATITSLIGRGLIASRWDGLAITAAGLDRVVVVR